MAALVVGGILERRRKLSAMLLGHNTNVAVGELTYHVQTEDRGAARATIETTVFSSGRVLHRNASDYSDLLPLNAERELSLKSRLDEQHRVTVQALRDGQLPPRSNL